MLASTVRLVLRVSDKFANELQVFGVGLTICVILGMHPHQWSGPPLPAKSDCAASQRYGWDIHVWDLGYNQIVAGRKVSFR